MPGLEHFKQMAIVPTKGGLYRTIHAIGQAYPDPSLMLLGHTPEWVMFDSY